MAVNDRQVPLLLSAERLSSGPVGPHVVFVALEQEALVPEKLPAWRTDRKKKHSAESVSTYRFMILNPDACLLNLISVKHLKCIKKKKLHLFINF